MESSNWKRTSLIKILILEKTGKNRKIWEIGHFRYAFDHMTFAMYNVECMI